MDSHSPTQTPVSPSASKTFNRRSLLKGSVGIAAAAVAAPAMALLTSKAEAATTPAATTPVAHVWDATHDFPGGI